VKPFWSRRRSLDLEAELRRNKPEPRSEFVTSLAEHVRTNRPTARVRVALAGALSVALLAALAPVGALGSAGSAAKGIANAAARVLETHARPVAQRTPAASQYPKKKKVCPKGTKRRGTKCVKVKKKGKAKAARVTHRGPRFTGGKMKHR
jgi:hypothetical protein